MNDEGRDGAPGDALSGTRVEPPNALTSLADIVRRLARLEAEMLAGEGGRDDHAEVRREALELCGRLAASGLMRHPALTAFATGLLKLAAGSGDEDLLEQFKAVACLPAPLPPTRPPQRAVRVTPPPAPEPAPPAPQVLPGASAGWEFYARPGDVADWQTVLMLSGCTWKCTGGGQRPVQLTRELMRLGKTVIYCGVHNEQRSGWIPGGLTCNLGDLRERVLPWLREVRGTAIVCLPVPDVIECADELSRYGWRVIYDCIDDWEAFAQSGYWSNWEEVWEARAVGIADVVTASAKHLGKKVERWRPRRVEYLPNAGGLAAVTRTGKPPGDLVRGANGTVIYVGAVDGTWLDWSLVAQARGLLQERGLAINIIGGYTVEAGAAGHCLGQKPVDEIGPYLAWSDVAIVPFGDPVISRSVDPIKYYEYRAAGLRVVATDVLTELRGRPGVELVRAEAPAFRRGVEKAIRLGRLPATKTELAAGSWPARAKALLPLLRPAVGKSDLGTQGLPKSVREADCVLRVSWDMTTRCNLQCPYCNTEPARRGRPAQPASPRTILWAWERLAASAGGPLYLSVDFGDPMADEADVALIAELAARHKVDVVTNLKFGVKRLGPLRQAGANLAFACSYHPHAWRSLTQFIDKYQRLAHDGWRMGVVALVGWPPYLPRLQDWVGRLRQEGISAYVLPFQGMHEGHLYPQAYSAAEQQMLTSPELTYEDSHGLEELGMRDAVPTGRLCATGVKYVYVHNDGTMVRCPYDTHALGNLFTGQWSLLDGPTACRAELCVCPDLWRYVVTP